MIDPPPSSSGATRPFAAHDDGPAPAAATLVAPIGIFLAIASLLWVLAPTRPLFADTLNSLRKGARSREYIAPTLEEVRRAEELFRALLGLDDVELERARALGRELELDVVELRQAGEEFIVVRETPGDRRGRGLFAFRRRRGEPFVVEAPHSYFDKGTGYLAERWFLESRAAAGAWNTVSRKVPVHAPEGARHGDELSRLGEGRAADMAHLEESYFQSFTRAFAATYPRGILVQLHGFSQAARTTAAGARSEAIVSNGVERPETWLIRLDTCLEDALSARVSAFPAEVSELGATTNTQNALLRSLGHRGFLHLELSSTLRDRLRGSAELRGAFSSCVPVTQ